MEKFIANDRSNHYVGCFHSAAICGSSGIYTTLLHCLINFARPSLFLLIKFLLCQISEQKANQTPYEKLGPLNQSKRFQRRCLLPRGTLSIWKKRSSLKCVRKIKYTEGSTLLWFALFHAVSFIYKDWVLPLCSGDASLVWLTRLKSK